MSLVTGLHMEQIVEFFSQMNIATCHRATLYRLQSLFVNPIIWVYWTQMKSVLLDNLKNSGRSITVTGDGQGNVCKGLTGVYLFYASSLKHFQI
jgi:hypothetical protein